MNAGKNALRKLVLGEDIYLWGVSHQHNHGSHEHGCREVFTAYREGQKAAPLRVFFDEESAPRGAAGIVSGGHGGDVMNLNQPGTARALIEAALVAGWAPFEAKSPFVVEDGLALLRDVQP